MDLQVMELAHRITPFLLSLMPYLLKMGEKATEEVGKKIGGEGWDKAKALWSKLGRKDEVKIAAETAVALPDNPAIQLGLETEIARALEEDKDLRQEITRLWGEAKAAGVTVLAKGVRSVAIGGNVNKSTIVTGDDNKVKR